MIKIINYIYIYNYINCYNLSSQNNYFSIINAIQLDNFQKDYIF